jgi:hypothetical protein
MKGIDMQADSHRAGKAARSIFGIALLATLALGCDRGQAEPSMIGASNPPASLEPDAACEVSEPYGLPAEARESSGLARSRRSANLLWTHNDAGNEPVLFATDTSGRLVGRVTVSGARLVDWEDLQAGPCKAGDCLFVGDIGDNDGDRATVTVYVVPEPTMDGGSERAASATAIQLRYPDQPQDSEAFFVLPSGELFIVTKGRDGPIALYRAPGAAAAGSTVELERVRQLWAMPRDRQDRVTGASASPDGKWVAIRTYRTLHVYRTADLIAGEAAAYRTTDLSSLAQANGEAVVLTDSGTIWLSSEAGKEGGPSLVRLECTLDNGGAGATG